MIKLFFGMPGYGKSTLMHDLVSLQSETHRFFIVDHDASWGEDGLLWRNNPPQPLIVFHKGERIPDKLPDTGVFVFRNWEPFDVASLAVAFGNTVYVDDEIDKTARRKGWESSGLRAIVHEGRHLPNKDGEITQCHIMGACRRPQNLHTDITDIADEFFIFRVKGMNTLKRLQADSLLEDNEEWGTIRNLEKFQCLHWPSGKFYEVRGIDG